MDKIAHGVKLIIKNALFHKLDIPTANAVLLLKRIYNPLSPSPLSLFNANAFSSLSFFTPVFRSLFFFFPPFGSLPSNQRE